MPQFINQPSGGRFDTPLPLFRAWYATKADVSFENVRLLGPRGPIAFTRVPRPDVQTAYPGHSVIGLSAWLDEDLLAVDSFSIRLVRNGESECASFTLSVSPAAKTGLQELQKVRRLKRNWCLFHLRCPLCGFSALESMADVIACPGCGTEFIQNMGALNLLTPELFQSCRLLATTNVSSNNYDATSLEMIRQVRATGGMILDCGAGFRQTPSETVVNVEIVDYPSTDLMAVGQSLPFRDASFDAAFSFAVLEHVSDPFACARELMRVVKPGGKIYCHVPFLQPEHGYPNHYYNMTREGLRNLFPDMQILAHAVPPSGSPVFALHWIIERYANGLPFSTRKRFLKMRMHDIISRSPAEWLPDSIVTELTEEERWILACTTAILLRKPE